MKLKEMFSERTFQSQIVLNDFKSKPRHMRVKKKKSFINRLRSKAKSYIVLFLDTSSIHGLNHLVARRRHPFEIIIWLLMVMLSVFGTIYLSGTTWLRYQSSPTVISMDRDMFAWNTTFPGVTVCPLKKIDETKLEDYLKKSKEPDKEKLAQFIRTLANATYETFSNITEYNGTTVPPSNYMDLLLSLAPSFSPSLTIGASGIILMVQKTITEMGLCYAVNSKVAVYNSPAYRAANRWDIVKSNESMFFVHPLDGEMFAQLINLSTTYEAYIHGPMEVPDISTKHEFSEEGYYMKLYVSALAVYTSHEAAKLSIGQRKCRYLHENNLRHNSVYTYNMCRMECRIRLCLERCQCIPHFYRRIGDEKICDVDGLRCLANYKDELYKLRDKNDVKTHCGCLSSCDENNYVLQSNVLQPWFLGTNLQWGIGMYPRMRYRRDIIFGFTDVLVAVGSMAGLFLGCSVLSFMEIIYFLTLRLVCYAHKHNKK